MVVLGVNETHCATAALLQDGRIIGCASEERFTRLKNDAGYPRLAIDALLRQCRVSPAQIDASRGKFGISQAERLAFVTEHLGIPRERIVCLDHHSCHAAAAYFGSGFAGREALVLTNDNSGDGLCATASTGAGSSLTRHEATPSAPGSLGAFYSFVTLALGMKFGEHEYKVMGMAPYASEKYTSRAEAALREVFDLEGGTPARFRWREPGERYGLLLRATLGLRFDAVAGGAQRLLEDTLLRWIRLMHDRYGGTRVA